MTINNAAKALKAAPFFFEGVYISGYTIFIPARYKIAFGGFTHAWGIPIQWEEK